MIYHNRPIDRHTAAHAIQYLRAAATLAATNRQRPVNALDDVVRAIERPCRAVGVARMALIRAGSIDEAVAELERS